MAWSIRLSRILICIYFEEPCRLERSQGKQFFHGNSIFQTYTSPRNSSLEHIPLHSQIKTFNMGIASVVKKCILLNWIFTKKKESCFIRKHIDERIDKYNTVIDVNQIANHYILASRRKSLRDPWKYPRLREEMELN